MRILLVHNFYRERGGEDTIVESDLRSLLAHGHEAELFSKSSNDLRTLPEKAGAIFHLAYSRESKEALAKKIRSMKPDLVHVHNFFPTLTPAIYDACNELSVPVVQTFHNYRTICANALFLRHGKPCTLCLKGSPYQSVAYACYRDSRLASLPLAHMIQRHRRENTWNRKIQRILVPTEFSRQLHISSGINPEKIEVRIHSLAQDPGFSPMEKRSNHGLFIGRLSEEKGLTTLLNAARHFVEPIQVIGQGPLLELVRNGKNLLARGYLSTEEVFAALKSAKFLVFPTECFEGAFPLTLVEAMATGTPIIASRIGAIPDFLRDGEDALLFPAGDAESLYRAMQRMAMDASLRKSLAENARKKFEESLSPTKSYQQLVQAYESVLAGA